MLDENSDRNHIIVRTSLIGIAANVFLALFKAVIGMLSHSIAIIMDAVNNFSDVLSSVITIVGIKLASKQPDKKHPWGHGRVEYLTAMVIAVIILYAGVTSLTASCRKIIHPEVPEYTAVELLIIAVAVGVKIVLGRYVKRVGESVNSEALADSGQDALMDSIISASTLLAAVVFIMTDISLESYVGALISVVIIKSGIDMLRQTISELLGQRIDMEVVRGVKKILMDIPEVHGVYDLVFHDYGPDRLNCSAHIEVEDTLTATDIDQIQRTATMELYKKTGIILTALSVYVINTKNEEIKRIREKITGFVMRFDYVLEVHGFYFKDQCITFDLIISFDAEDRVAVYQEICQKVKKEFPEYQFQIVLDTDFSVSE